MDLGKLNLIYLQALFLFEERVGQSLQCLMVTWIYLDRVCIQLQGKALGNPEWSLPLLWGSGFLKKPVLKTTENMLLMTNCILSLKY